MKLRAHLALIALGALLMAAVGIIVGYSVPPIPSWYHYPFIFPVYVASKFGRGGEDLNAIAANVAWAVECVIAGIVIDAVVALFRRWFGMNRAEPKGSVR